MDKTRWTFNALYENMNKESQYYKYINKIRDELDIHDFISNNEIKNKLEKYFLNELNIKITQMKLPINKITKLKLQ